MGLQVSSLFLTMRCLGYCRMAEYLSMKGCGIMCMSIAISVPQVLHLLLLLLQEL